MQEQLQLSSNVNVISQKSSNEFNLSAAKHIEEVHTATPLMCDCSYFSRMSLPCKHILKVHALLGIPSFCKSFVHRRWTISIAASLFLRIFLTERKWIQVRQLSTLQKSKKIRNRKFFPKPKSLERDYKFLNKLLLCLQKEIWQHSTCDTRSYSPLSKIGSLDVK